MKVCIKPQAEFLIGPPGSGKDTQALLLVESTNFVEVPTSQIIRKHFAEHPDDPIIKREKQRYADGFLTDPTVFVPWLMEFVQPLVAQGKDLVFSGSPRVPQEANMLIPAIQKLCGTERVQMIHIHLSEAEARKRIAGRRFCKAHAHPIPDTPEFAHLTVCPQDGSPLERRALDDADKQDRRFEQFYTLTEPCLKIAQDFGVPVFEIDGRQSIEAVHRDIIDVIECRHSPMPRT